MVEMSANEKRSYVEDRWEWSVFWKPAPLPIPHEYEVLPWTMQVADAKCLDVHEFTGATEEECVSSAYEFTRKRQEEIRLINQQLQFLEISLSEVKRGSWDVGYVPAVESIITEKKAALAELQSGMKEAPHGKTQ